MTTKGTPSNCTLMKCKYNYVAPPEESQECIGCEGNVDKQWRPRTKTTKRKAIATAWKAYQEAIAPAEKAYKEATKCD